MKVRENVSPKKFRSDTLLRGKGEGRVNKSLNEREGLQ